MLTVRVFILLAALAVGNVFAADVEPVLTGAEIIALQETVREVPLSDHIARYALALVRQTRVGEQGGA